MGGKRLKFPKRKKYVAPDKQQETEEEEKPISEEEHNKRVAYLKSMGLVK